MQNQPVMGVGLIFSRNALHEQSFNLSDIFAGRHAGTVSDTKNMGIHGDDRLTKSGIQYDIRGFSANAGQRFQRGSIVRNFSMVPIDKLFAGGDDVAGFGTVQADSAYMVFQPCHAEFKHGVGCRGHLKQFARCQIDALIRGLRGQNDCHQQFKIAAVFQFGGRVRVGRCESRKNGANRR